MIMRSAAPIKADETRIQLCLEFFDAIRKVLEWHNRCKTIRNMTKGIS